MCVCVCVFVFINHSHLKANVCRIEHKTIWIYDTHPRKIFYGPQRDVFLIF